MNNIDLLDFVYKTVAVELEGYGFSREKKFYKKIIKDSDDVILKYEAVVSSRKGFFSLHLVLVIEDKKISKKVNDILKPILERKIYPEQWADSDIKYSIKSRLSDKSWYRLTDWRVFRENGEGLAEFNSRFNIWVCSFDDINDIPSWRDQLLLSAKYANYFYVNNCKIDWIINNTGYHSLVILADIGDKDGLKNRSIKSRDKINGADEETELRCFYESLINSKIDG